MTYVTAFLNLFNLLPPGSLDGGRVTKALSPVIWVLGIIGAVILIWKLRAYILVLILVLGLIEVVSMIKNRQKMADYLDVEPRFRLLIGVSYIILVGVLAVIMMYSLEISAEFARSMRK
ncbi:Zn-dependent protease [Desulfohalotomaculum tongense]|uniref:hypothetical protein n=1 Tax=Desulforadius tongensis TaxID=1216062 RepID=UPI00195C1E4C|nr:hypothetical protein [Desulforadius tongensis]MBM7856000.1 Zn-dependent protease [Desulforadius tongensis]